MRDTGRPRRCNHVYRASVPSRPAECEEGSPSSLGTEMATVMTATTTSAATSASTGCTARRLIAMRCRAARRPTERSASHRERACTQSCSVIGSPEYHAWSNDDAAGASSGEEIAVARHGPAQLCGRPRRVEVHAAAARGLEQRAAKGAPHRLAIVASRCGSFRRPPLERGSSLASGSTGVPRTPCTAAASRSQQRQEHDGGEHRRGEREAAPRPEGLGRPTEQAAEEVQHVAQQAGLRAAIEAREDGRRVHLVQRRARPGPRRRGMSIRVPRREHRSARAAASARPRDPGGASARSARIGCSTNGVGAKSCCNCWRVVRARRREPETR